MDFLLGINIFETDAINLENGTYDLLVEQKLNYFVGYAYGNFRISKIKLEKNKINWINQYYG